MTFLLPALLACGSGTRFAGEAGDDDATAVEDTGEDRAGDTSPGDVAGDEGDACSRPPAAPAPLAPENGAYTGSLWAPTSFRTRRPLFRWRPPEPDGCESPTYEIQLDDSCTAPGFAACAFTVPDVADAGIVATAWSPLHPLPVSDFAPVGRRYYWRVRACRAGACSPWSAVRYLEVGRVPTDVNGDGYSDMVVASPLDGRAFLFLGGAVPDAVPDVALAVPPAHDDGVRVAAADLNADGMSDVLVGSVAAGPDGTGGVFVFLGAEIPDDVADVVWDGAGAGDWFGVDVAAGGDLDADGFPDAAAVAESFDTAGHALGRVDVFLGGAVPASTPVASVRGDRDEPVGHRVALVGDVNGNGHADLLLGGWRGPKALCDGAALPDLTPLVVLAGREPDDGFGISVARTDDVDGDGHADLLVGALGGEAPDGTHSGYASLFLGGPSPSSEASLVVVGDAPMDYFGRSVAGAGDVNADGFADFAVGAIAGGESFAGTARLYLGGEAPDGTVAVLLEPTMADGRRFGFGLGAAGDVNGDGYADVLAGEPADGIPPDGLSGRAYLFCGGAVPDAEPELVLTGEPGGGFGASVAAAAWGVTAR